MDAPSKDAAKCTAVTNADTTTTQTTNGHPPENDAATVYDCTSASIVQNS